MTTKNIKISKNNDTVGLLDILGLRKQWQYYKSISVGQIFDRMSGNTSDHR